MTCNSNYLSNVPGDQYCKHVDEIQKEYKTMEKERKQSSQGNQTGGAT